MATRYPLYVKTRRVIPVSTDELPWGSRVVMTGHLDWGDLDEYKENPPILAVQGLVVEEIASVNPDS